MVEALGQKRTMQSPARYPSALEAPPAVKQTTKSRPKPSRAEWAVAIAALLVQQGAFVSIPLYFDSDSLLIRQEPNGFNTAITAISFASIAIASVWQRERLAALASKNAFSLLFLVLVLLSMVWSIHPDLTFRRGVGYVLTILVAAYLTVRFEPIDRMKVLSYAFAISAIGSFLFVAAFPADGIMRGAELAGDWRGVFPHKNVLGPTMAAGVFVQLAVLVAQDRPPKWQFALLATFLALVFLSHSSTGIVLSAFYLVGIAIYLLGRRSLVAGALSATLAVSLVAIALVTLVFYPEFVFGLAGKDVTLTGRTQVWSVVLTMIEQKPLLGYGYRAAWALNDAATIQADTATGGWGVGSSHNSFLELTLQLGLVGAAMMAAILVSAAARAIRWFRSVPGPQGYLFLLFLTGTLAASLVMETLGQNQVIEWVIFNVLLFSSNSLRSQKKVIGHTRSKGESLQGTVERPLV